MQTSLTKLLDISIPILQAPMAGGGDTVELVAAVSEAGALGSIGAAYLTPEQIIERGKAVRSATSRPFGINLFAPTANAEASPEAMRRAMSALAPFYHQLGIEPIPVTNENASINFDDQLWAALETGASVFSFTFGLLPESAVVEIKRRKLLLMGTATTVEEARALADLGVDAVIAQGSEAGGHRGTFSGDFVAGMVGGLSLVPQMADAVSVPVVASGGIMDGRALAAALALGASAVQLGTAFLTCQESGVPEAYKEAILNAHEDQTRITRAFSGRPARGIANRFLTEVADETVLPFPLQNAVTRPLRREAARQNRAEFLSLWAGQGTRLARRTSARELVHQIHEESRQAIDRLSSVTNQIKVS